MDQNEPRRHPRQLESLRTLQQLGTDAETSEHVQTLESVAADLQEMTSSSRAKHAAEYAKQALNQATRRYPLLDDDENAVAEAVSELVQTHIEACTAAGLDGVPLAEWLLEAQQLEGCRLLRFEAHLDGLGDDGLEAYGRRLVEIWSANPVDPGLRRAVEEYARFYEDDELLLQIQSSPDRHGHVDFLALIETLRAADRHEEAVEWAERGAQESNRPQVQQKLVDFLVESYTSQGRAEDLYTLRQSQLESECSIEAYLALKEAAGEKSWPQRRPIALDLLRAEADDVNSPFQENAAGTLVDALLHESDPEAWEAARNYGAEHGQARQALALLAETDADTAIEEVKAEIVRQIAMETKDGDARAADFAFDLRKLFAKQHRAPESRHYFTRLRVDNSRRLRFQSELRNRGI